MQSKKNEKDKDVYRKGVCVWLIIKCSSHRIMTLLLFWL